MGKFVSKMFENEEIKILMLGLDSSGKTTILYNMREETCLSTIPTIGYELETVVYKKTKLNVFDIGGQRNVRFLWSDHFAGTQGMCI